MTEKSRTQQVRRIVLGHDRMKVVKLRGQNSDAYYLKSDADDDWHYGSPTQPLSLTEVENWLGINSSPLDAARNIFMYHCVINKDFFLHNYHKVTQQDEVLCDIRQTEKIGISSVFEWYKALSNTDLPTWTGYYHWPSAVFIYPIVFDSFIDLVRERWINEEFQKQVFDHFIVHPPRASREPIEWVNAKNNAQLATHT